MHANDRNTTIAALITMYQITRDRAMCNVAVGVGMSCSTVLVSRISHHWTVPDWIEILHCSAAIQQLFADLLSSCSGVEGCLHEQTANKACQPALWRPSRAPVRRARVQASVPK